MGQRASGLMRRFYPFGDSEPPEQVEVDNRNRRPPLRPDPSNNNNGSEYFSTHFLMGGNRFEVSKPEGFLFGQNSDLDLLGAPVKFPYGGVSESVGVLNALVNIRKDSVKISKKENQDFYNLEFIFDSDSKCYIQVHYCARELVEGNNIKFDVRLPDLKPSEKFYFDVGADQVFNHLELAEQQFDPQKVNYNGGFWYPVVIEIRSNDPESGFREQSQITMCVLEKTQNNNCAYSLKPLKQKLITDGVIYMMQEVFGIENRETDRDRAFECVVCRDSNSNTLLLPCRHLCICKHCDSDFLSNVKECPICRTPVKALLILNAVKMVETHNARSSTVTFENVDLTEALNGPLNKPASRQSTFSRGSSRSSCNRDLQKRDHVRDIFPRQSIEENEHEVIELEDIQVN